MAADNASAAVLGLGEVNGVRPAAERHFLADMLALGTGMGAVAGGTGSPLLPIDMEEVEVILAITEVGQFRCLLLPGNILVMAAETEVILGRAVGIIKIHRERPPKELGKGGSMNLAMASRTVTGLDRPMPEIGISHFVAEFNMALEAELLHGVIQQRFIIG